MKANLLKRIFFFFPAVLLVVLTGSVSAQMLPQVCKLRGTIGTAPAGGATGVMTNRVHAPGVPTATCSGVQLPNPFNGGIGNYPYNVHKLTNPSIFPICVPIRLIKTNPRIVDSNLHLSVFQWPFLSAHITNSGRFLGDAGVSTGDTVPFEATSFSVVIPGNSSVALVVADVGNDPPGPQSYEIDFCTTSTDYSGVARIVPDNTPAGVNVTLPVSTSGRVSDVNFKFKRVSAMCNAVVGNSETSVEHSFVGDLTFRLTAPGGSASAVFMERRGGTRENICTTTIDDDRGFSELSTITSTTGSSVSGYFAAEPTGLLSKLDGAQAQGNWVLNVSDNANNDTGVVHRFGLEITTIPRKAQFDYDGDGRTDVSIFRPGAGEWWVSKSSNGGNFALQFGTSTDRLVPGDYTGDGIVDIAFWRPSTGQWFILRSEDSSFYAVPFGTLGDVAVPGDYDGDTFIDIAVFRPSIQTWFIQRSSGGVDILGFGAAGDKPVVADYDGDGKTDVAIFRPSDGSWWYRNSRSGATSVAVFGTGTERAAPGDYTGDGRADLAIWQPSTGFWFIQRSEDNSFYSLPFGATGDIPAAGDYDGDGKFDQAVFRPTTSTWYVNGSQSGTTIQQFGAAGDFPTPNSFVP